MNGRGLEEDAAPGGSHRQGPVTLRRGRGQPPPVATRGAVAEAGERGEPTALARSARRGEAEEEDEGDRSRAALLVPVAALAARRERSGEGGSGRERARKGKEKQKSGEGKSEGGYYIRFAGF